MNNPIIYAADAPYGRPATEQEVAEFLSGMTAMDGTNYLDIYRECLEEEEQ